jgi:hypothetical protein
LQTRCHKIEVVCVGQRNKEVQREVLYLARLAVHEEKRANGKPGKERG